MNQIKAYNIFGRQVAYVIASSLIVTVLGVIQTPILTKSLGSSSYGVWSLISTTVLLMFPFGMLSFNNSIVRFLAAEKDNNKIREDFYSAFLLVLISGAIFSLLLFLFSGFIATYVLKDLHQVQYIRLGSILVSLYSLFPVLLAFFKREGNIGIYTVLDLSFNVISFGLMVFFVLSGFGLRGLLLAIIVSSLALNIIALVIIFNRVGFQRPHFYNMKSYLKWGIPLIPNSAIWWIIQASDRYIIAYFLGESAVGIYSIANTIGLYSSFALMPVATVLYPIISKKYDEGNYDECRNYFQYSFKYLMMVTIPAAFGLSILAKPLLQILTTSEFISGNYVVALCAFGALLNCFQQLCSYILHLVGKTQIILRILSIGAVLNVIFNIALVPRMGILGAGVGSLISYGVLGLLTLLVTRRYLKFDLNLLFILKSLIASFIMGLGIWLLKPESLFTVVVSIIVGILLYFTILLIIRGFSKTELAFFLSFVRKSITINKS